MALEKKELGTTAGKVEAGQKAAGKSLARFLALWRLCIEGEPPKVGKRSSKGVLLRFPLSKLLIVSGLSGRLPVESGFLF